MLVNDSTVLTNYQETWSREDYMYVVHPHAIAPVSSVSSHTLASSGDDNRNRGTSCNVTLELICKTADYTKTFCGLA
jgi:hypothetical protein